MKTKKKKWIVVAALIFIGIAAGITSIFYGLPWKERAVAKKLEKHLEEKYDQDFVLKRTSYNWKFSWYGGSFYPEGDPDLAFHAEDIGQNEYMDTYPEVVWNRQLQEKIKPFYQKVYPDVDTFETLYTEQSADMVPGPDIPDFTEVDAMLSVIYHLKKPFKDETHEWEKIAALTEKGQKLSRNLDVVFRYTDKGADTEVNIICPTVEEEGEISDAEEAKEKCSVSRYELESGEPLDQVESSDG